MRFLVFSIKFFQRHTFSQSQNLISFNARKAVQWVWKIMEISNITFSNLDFRNGAFELASNLFHFQSEFPIVLKIFPQYLKTITWWIMDFFQRQAKQKILSVFVAWCHIHLIGLSLKKNQRFQQLSIILEIF